LTTTLGPKQGAGHMLEPALALRRLQEGNARFVNNLRSDALTSPVRRAEVADVQRPFAVILGCSDARVPAEIVFDQGLGDLFVIRIAGNVVAPSGIGSVEFAVERFGVQLVVVLGHSRCGAIDATLEAVSRPGQAHSPGIRSIVDRVRPSIEGLLQTELARDRTRLWQEAVRANIRASVNQLRHGSEILERLVLAGRVEVAGAEYALDSGEVTFLD
jgi:carbonic anhydrase